MHLLRPLLLLCTLLSLSWVFAQDSDSSQVAKEKFDYQSDVARLRKIVINSLYSHREVFLRELISNANDALEKLRLVSLRDKHALDPNHPLNITIKFEKDEDKHTGRLTIADTGIGMSAEELKANLGTLAKSGTTEFLAKAEGDSSGNLIGQFGLGFYSSFLVASEVLVASRPIASTENPDPVQHVFSSSADEGSFEIYPDPRGNTMEHGTEITLILKSDALEYAESSTVQTLVEKHSAFSTAYPIYLFDQLKEEVPDEDDVTEETVEEKVEVEEKPDSDEEAVIEDAPEKEVKPKKMKTILKDTWLHLNEQPPLWMRDPKNVTDEEYKELYKTTFHDYKDPLAWQHFSGDSSGTSFRAVLFVPSELPADFWNSHKPLSKDVRLLVKRVFITSELGDEALPKWISWLRVIVDADDLPLNVSRETLQSTRFLRQLRTALIKKLVQLMTKIAEDEPERFLEISKVFNPVFKLGALEDGKENDKLVPLVRWDTNQRNSTSLDQYIANRKKGQTQIFYLAGLGQKRDDLEKSVFMEKLSARGYEVLLFPEPLDEILSGKLRKWGGMKFQDAAKEGLKFGDEDADAEEEKEKQKQLEERYKPLLEWLKEQTKMLVVDVVISRRLVTSPCAVVALEHGYSANMERLMSAQTNKNTMMEWAKGMKNLEINPNSPLIEGMLRRVEQLNARDEDDKDVEGEAELKEVASILIDTALVRSGFDVADPNTFFTRVDHVLRRSLGVSETAETKVEVKPAPPVEEGPVNPEPEPEEMTFNEADFMDYSDFKKQQDAKKMVEFADEMDRQKPLQAPPEPEAATDEHEFLHDEL